jgi:hypothetical protein
MEEINFTIDLTGSSSESDNDDCLNSKKVDIQLQSGQASFDPPPPPVERRVQLSHEQHERIRINRERALARRQAKLEKNCQNHQPGVTNTNIDSNKAEVNFS